MQSSATDRGEARARALAPALIALALVSFALLRVPFVSVPLERDEGEYAYVAQRMLAGDVPYRDAFDQKPPAVFLTYAAAFALLGESIESIRIFLYLWTAVTAVLLHALVCRLAGPLAAAFALLIFAISSTDPALSATAANTEIFLLLPAVGSLVCLVRALDRGARSAWLGCGAALAAAFWFKPVAAPQALLVLVFAGATLWARGAGAGASARAGLWLALGAAGVSAPILGYLAASGAWQPFVDAVFVHNWAYAQRLSPGEGGARLGAALARQLPSFSAFWTLAALALLAPRLSGRWAWALLAGWTLASAVGVSLGLYFRPHYFVQLLPPLAALGGVGSAALARRLLAAEPPALAWLGASALAATLVAPPVVAHRATLLAGSPERVSRHIYGLNPFPESLAIGRYIREASQPDDRVYVIGSEPQILFYAGRRSATRYIFFYPLTAAYPDALERQREALREVAEAEPRYVVWAQVPTSTLVRPETDATIFRESARMLNRAYRLEVLSWLDLTPALADPERLPELEAQGFAFAYGDDARRALAAAIDARDRHLWLAVYRRAR